MVRKITREGLGRLIRGEVRRLREAGLGPVKMGRLGDFGQGGVDANYDRAVDIGDQFFNALQSLHAALDAENHENDALSSVEDMFDRVSAINDELVGLEDRVKGR